jgi:uncharacterized phage-associated protein
MLTAAEIASYFLAKVEVEDGELISNLKLQKLLYYAQGNHLALYDAILFPEPIEAWNHGPVVPAVYHQYKQYGPSPLPCPGDFELSKFSNELQDFLEEVYDVYGQFSAWKLRQMSHEEPPWKNAYEKGRATISTDAMKTFFKTLLVADGR